MKTVNTNMLLGSKGAGLALMVGVILAIVASLFYPGGPFINPVDQLDFAAAVAALGEQPNLAHLMTMLVIVGMLLHIYGICALLRLGKGERCLGSIALRTGVFASLFAWGIFIVGLSQRHMAIHLMQRSANSAESVEMAQQFEALALDSQISMAGLLMGFVWIWPIASSLVGLGLVARLGSLDVFKVAAYGFVVVGAGGIVIFLLAQHASGLNVTNLLMATNIFQMFGSIFLFITGLGLYQGRSGFVPDEESAG